jgi:hypothetical protein
MSSSHDRTQSESSSATTTPQTNLEASTTAPASAAPTANHKLDNNEDDHENNQDNDTLDSSTPSTGPSTRTSPSLRPHIPSIPATMAPPPSPAGFHTASAKSLPTLQQLSPNTNPRLVDTYRVEFLDNPTAYTANLRSHLTEASRQKYERCGKTNLDPEDYNEDLASRLDATRHELWQGRQRMRFQLGEKVPEKTKAAIRGVIEDLEAAVAKLKSTLEE